MGIPFKDSASFGKRMEYFLVGKMLMEKLDVYLPLVDDHGVDFIAKSKNGTFYEVQVKSVRDDNYVFIKKSKIVLQSNRLICFIRFNDNELPDCYVFPATVFEKPDGSLFTSKDYEGLKSQPEYGISVKKKENLEKMQKYQSEKILMELR